MAVKRFFKAEPRKRAFNGGGIRDKRVHTAIDVSRRIRIEREPLAKRRKSIHRNWQTEGIVFRLCVNFVDSQIVRDVRIHHQALDIVNRDAERPKCTHPGTPRSRDNGIHGNLVFFQSVQGAQMEPRRTLATTEIKHRLGLLGLQRIGNKLHSAQKRFISGMCRLYRRHVNRGDRRRQKERFFKPAERGWKHTDLPLRLSHS